MSSRCLCLRGIFTSMGWPAHVPETCTPGVPATKSRRVWATLKMWRSQPWSPPFAKLLQWYRSTLEEFTRPVWEVDVSPCAWCFPVLHPHPYLLLQHCTRCPSPCSMEIVQDPPHLLCALWVSVSHPQLIKCCTHGAAAATGASGTLKHRGNGLLF